ncbi:MAG: hypothetical protein R3A10_01305 [Caldilineaceae bacterium]
MSNSLDFTGWLAQSSLRSHPNIVMGHGGGGKLSGRTGGALSARARQRHTGLLGDSAQLDVNGARLAFSTDSYVVRPLFPGGNIGELAVNGAPSTTDAMSGAQPLFEHGLHFGGRAAAGSTGRVIATSMVCRALRALRW